MVALRDAAELKAVYPPCRPFTSDQIGSNVVAGMEDTLQLD
jgi:hypothetical protein